MTVYVIGDNTGDDYAGNDATFIQEDSPTSNSGYNGTFQVGKESAGTHNHGVIKFQGLSSVSASYVPTSAIMSLYLSSGSATSDTITAKRLLRDWVFNQVTWNIYSTGNNWTSGGALSDGNDRSAATSDTLTAGSTTSQYYDFDDSAQIIADTTDFIDGSLINYGWHLERTDGADDGNHKWYASDRGTDGQRPYLTIDDVSAGTTIDATSDSLVLTEYAAAVSAAKNISATSASLSITEYAASISAAINVQATTDIISLTEYAASISLAINIQTNSDALVITEYAATIDTSIETNVIAGFDALSITEFAASIEASKNVLATTDILLITEYAASIASGVVSPTISSRIHTIEPENRVNTIPYEDRISLILSEDRTYIISGD